MQKVVRLYTHGKMSSLPHPRAISIKLRPLLPRWYLRQSKAKLKCLRSGVVRGPRVLP